MSSHGIDDLRRKLNLFGFIDARAYLNDLFIACKNANKPYSYIRFTADLGLGSSNLMCHILRAKRKVTLHMCPRISEALRFDRAESEYFRKLVERQGTRDQTQKEELFQRLVEIRTRTLESPDSRLQLSFFNHWLHPVVFEMIGAKPGCPDERTIQSRLRFPVPLDQIKKSVSLLKGLGLISFDENSGCFQKLKDDILTPAEVADLGILRFHQKMIDLAKDALTGVDEHEREISSLTLSIPRGRSQEVKSLLREMERFLMFRLKEMSSSAFSQGEDVCQINIQMFPLTR